MSATPETTQRSRWERFSFLNWVAIGAASVASAAATGKWWLLLIGAAVVAANLWRLFTPKRSPAEPSAASESTLQRMKKGR